MNVSKKPIARREEAANLVLMAIATTGRQLFNAPGRARVARFYLDEHEQVWYIDHLTGLQFAPMAGDWKGCSVGETGRALIQALERFIRRGELVPFSHLQNDWGYGSAMEPLVQALLTLNVFDKEEQHA